MRMKNKKCSICGLADHETHTVTCRHGLYNVCEGCEDKFGGRKKAIQHDVYNMYKTVGREDELGEAPEDVEI